MAIKYNSNSKNAQIEALKRALDFTAEQLFTYINNVNATNNIFVWDGKPEITNSNLAFKVQTKTCQEFEFYQVSNTSSYSNSYTVGGGLGGGVVNPQSSLVVGSNRNLSYFDDWVLLVDVKNKTTYPVPSMFVYFLIQNANNKFTQKVVTCTLHVVSLATGAAVITAGAKGIQLLVALSEITSGLSGLATTALEPELRSLLGNDGYQNLQTVTALVDIAGISIQTMPGIAKKADNLLTRLDNIDFNTNLTPAKLQLKAIKDKLANVFGRGVNGVGNVALDVATATEKQLDDIFAGLQNTPPFKYTPNTLEHKAERWAQYKIEKGTSAKDYSNWSNVYNANMTKATKAHLVADEVMASIGWGQREVTVQAGNYTRRMDIADINLRKGVEVKSYETGKVYATQAIQGELNADKFLVEMQNWQIEWVFKSCEPSQPLRTLLAQGGITIKLVP